MRACNAEQVLVRLLWLVSLFVGSAFHLTAAIEELSVAQLREELKKGLVAGDLIPLRPVLNELSARTEGEAEREGYVFLLGLSYQDEFATSKLEATLRKAMDYYRQYVEWFPQGTRRAYVRFNLAGAHADLGEFEDAIRHYDWLYRRSKNAVLRQESRDRMCRLYMKHEKAAEGIPLFLEVFNAAVLDEELRAQAASWLLQGYLGAGQLEAIPPYLRYLTGDTEAVYDPAFNITLLKAGDKLFEEDAFDQAILLYSFVKPKSQIVAFYENLTAKLRKRLSYLSPESDQHTVLTGRLQTAEANLNALGNVRDYDVDMHWRVARVYLETDRNWEALWAFYHLYEDYPEHPQGEDFCYIAFSEACAAGNAELIPKLANEYLSVFPSGRFRNQVILGLADAYLSSDDETAFVGLVSDYLRAPEDNTTAAQLINKWALLLTGSARYQSLLEVTAPLIERLDGREPALESVRYWCAFAKLLLNDYAGASESFAGFVSDYTAASNRFAEDANYRFGIALFGEARNADAEAQFLRFVERYPGSRLRGEAELYLGDLKQGKSAFGEAIEHYQNVDQFSDRQDFISKAIFAISDIHLGAGRPDAAFAVIQDYLNQYGDEAHAAEALDRMGRVRESQGRVAERFRIHSEAIRMLGNDSTRHAVDDLILSYVEDFTRIQDSLTVSIQLLERLVADALFRSNFLTDRVFQYGYLQTADGQKVDATLRYALVRDRAMRATLIESETVSAEQVRGGLESMVQAYKSKFEALGSYDAVALFTELYAQAAEGPTVEGTLRLRSLMALDRLKQPIEGGYMIVNDQLREAPPAVLLWQANRSLESDKARAKALYRAVVQRFPFSKSALVALNSLAESAFLDAKKLDTENAWRTALVYFDQLAERTTTSSPSAEPLLKRAQVLMALEIKDDAIATLGSVLKNPSWRGIDHAKAHLALGKLYLEQGELQEAHGFFERLIVAYGGYLETVSWAYYYDLKTLEALEETESIEQLLAEYRTRLDVLQGTEAYQRIKEVYDL